MDKFKCLLYDGGDLFSCECVVIDDFEYFVV